MPEVTDELLTQQNTHLTQATKIILVLARIRFWITPKHLVERKSDSTPGRTDAPNRLFILKGVWLNFLSLSLHAPNMSAPHLWIWSPHVITSLFCPFFLLLTRMCLRSFRPKYITPQQSFTCLLLFLLSPLQRIHKGRQKVNKQKNKKISHYYGSIS